MNNHKKSLSNKMGQAHTPNFSQIFSDLLTFSRNFGNFFNERLGLVREVANQDARVGRVLLGSSTRKFQ
jgi:hypothetical protein